MTVPPHNKTVYIALAADILHHGHMKILSEGKKHGEVTIGLLTDEAIAAYKRLPILNYEQRKMIAENIKGVVRVVAQETLDYTSNLNALKPDVVIHGDDWKVGIQKEVRTKVINTLNKWGGQLIEITYTDEVSISKLDKLLKEIGTTPEKRRSQFQLSLQLKPITRILEAHNGLTGLVVENSKVSDNGSVREFDAIWISSLCDSTAKGKPDIELVDFTSRLNTVNEILEVTTKPIIFDGDTGGQIEHFGFMVKTLDRLGISGVIIEDKVGLKKNSLFGEEIPQFQDSIDNFCKKLSVGKNNKISSDFMIIARIESFNLNAGLEDAIKRAKAYIKAGADGIMIHSKATTPDEIFSFASAYKEFSDKVPLIVVPSTFDQVTEDELIASGVNVVIYANHLLRSAYPAMLKTAKSILKNQRAFEANEDCMSIKDILTLIPGG